MKPFAVFDIDGTLIRWQLFHDIVHSLGKYGHIPTDAHERITIARSKWKRRTTTSGFATYEDVLVDEYLAALKDVSIEDYQLVVNDVFEKYKDQTFTYTRDLLHSLVAFNPDQEFFGIANQHGWDIVVERKNMAFQLQKLDGCYQLTD